MKSLILSLILCATAHAQFPFDPTTGQWLQTLPNGGVNAGYYAGTATPASDHIRLGFFAGHAATGSSGVFIGRHAGYEALGDQAVMIGHAAGQYAGKGGDAFASVIIGYLAGRNALQLSPHHNWMSVQIGHEAAMNMQYGQMSTILGAWAGRNTANGQSSVMLGWAAGYDATDAINSIFIGAQAGANLSRNYTLVIESHPSIAPGGTGALIYGEFDTRLIQFGAEKMGFFGSPAVARPTVSGSRSDNSAFTSLLQALDALGLIYNQTTP